MKPIKYLPNLPRKCSEIDRKLEPFGILRHTSKSKIPVININNHTPIVVKQPGIKPDCAVAIGMPSIPAPIIVPAIKKDPDRSFLPDSLLLLTSEILLINFVVLKKPIFYAEE